MLPNMSAQLALPDGFYEGTHFVGLAHSEELDAAVAQIPHRTGDIEPLGYLPDGITKTNALDVAFVENLEGGDHVTRRIDPAFRRRQLLKAFFVCYGSDAATGRSGPGNSSGGGTRRGSFELRLNCLSAGPFLCGVVAAASNVEGAGLISSLAT